MKYCHIPKRCCNTFTCTSATCHTGSHRECLRTAWLSQKAKAQLCDTGLCPSPTASTQLRSQQKVWGLFFFSWKFSSLPQPKTQQLTFLETRLRERSSHIFIQTMDFKQHLSLWIPFSRQLGPQTPTPSWKCLEGTSAHSWTNNHVWKERN